MSDKQTEQERDAAVIARYREALVWIMREESGETVSLKTANRSREIFDGRHRDFTDAALRTIDRLSAERDRMAQDLRDEYDELKAIRAELGQLRAERDSVALAWAYLMRYSWNVSEPDRYVMRAEGILVGLNLPIVELPETEADHD